MRTFLLILVFFIHFSCSGSNDTENSTKNDTSADVNYVKNDDGSSSDISENLESDVTEDGLTDSGSGVDVYDGSYPAGPYGKVPGQIIKNHRFRDPNTKGIVELKDFYKKGKILLINASAGWCIACKQEVPDLIKFYEQYHDKGFEIAYTLFEDGNYNMPSDDFALMWQNNFDTPFHVLIDKEFQLGAYFDKSATPMNMLVRTSDMKIVYLTTGYDAFTIEAKIKSFISQ